MRSFTPNVASINAIEEKTKALSDEQLAAQTVEFRKLLAEGKALDDILVPAFAVVREPRAAFSACDLFDVQLISRMILHSNAIAEMKTR